MCWRTLCCTSLLAFWLCNCGPSACPWSEQNLLHLCLNSSSLSVILCFESCQGVLCSRNLPQPWIFFNFSFAVANFLFSVLSYHCPTLTSSLKSKHNPQKIQIRVCPLLWMNPKSIQYLSLRPQLWISFGIGDQNFQVMTNWADHVWSLSNTA